MPTVCVGLTQARGSNHAGKSHWAWFDRTDHLVVLDCRKDRQQMNREANSAFCVSRKLKLTADVSNDMLKKLSAISGVQSVTNGKRNLMVTYDAREVSLEHIEREVSLPYSQSLWQRLRRSLYQFGDKNLADGAKHAPHCCNKIR
ncbi:hypothetical protein LRP49_09685 [Enterovibrio sp. ZSDZ35]|uniref:Uncharacterized protein n=1 Tax=Enterovibrio qingdaonensis TaxID=2899818 RepID=A0ABT5QLG9_9GAMM|nr:hypothetical protein [Enterovibrio sp. ZSDZ35]MDD1781469.1 hypothetical protein [Enterovibrio sp. ZSDZ35]